MERRKYIFFFNNELSRGYVLNHCIVIIKQKDEVRRVQIATVSNSSVSCCACAVHTYPMWKLESGWGSVQVQQWLCKSCPLGTGILDSLCK